MIACAQPRLTRQNNIHVMHKSNGSPFTVPLNSLPSKRTPHKIAAGARSWLHVDAVSEDASLQHNICPKNAREDANSTDMNE